MALVVLGVCIFLGLVDKSTGCCIGTPQGCVHSNNKKRQDSLETSNAIYGIREAAVEPTERPPKAEPELVGLWRVFTRREVGLRRHGHTSTSNGCEATWTYDGSVSHTPVCRGHFEKAMTASPKLSGRVLATEARRVDAAAGDPAPTDMASIRASIRVCLDIACRRVFSDVEHRIGAYDRGVSEVVEHVPYLGHDAGKFRTGSEEPVKALVVKAAVELKKRGVKTPCGRGLGCKAAPPWPFDERRRYVSPAQGDRRRSKHTRSTVQGLTPEEECLVNESLRTLRIENPPVDECLTKEGCLSAMYTEQHRHGKLYVYQAELEAKCVPELLTPQDVKMVQRSVVGHWMNFVKEIAQQLASTEQLETGDPTAEGPAPEDEWNYRHAARVLNKERCGGETSITGEASNRMYEQATRGRRGGGWPRACKTGSGWPRTGSGSKSCGVHDGTA